MAAPNLPVEVARFVLDYDADAGVLRWKVYAGGNSGKGVVAGCSSTHSKHYPVVRVFGERYLCHRLAWFIVHGVWPDQLDHVNGDKSDFRLCNLREVDGSQNRFNSKRYSNNTSGFKGVGFDKRCGKWNASISARGKAHWLGSFGSAEAAQAAYAAGAAKYHGPYARAN